LLAEPITVASMSVPLRTVAPFSLEITGDDLEQAAIEPLFDKLAAKAHEGGALGRRLVAGKAAEAAEARPVRERLGQDHIGKIIPGRQQQRLEHRQGRPGLLAFCPRIKSRQKLIHRPPIDHGGQRVEACWTLDPCAEWKNFLTNPPMRHETLHIGIG
jgi:hypothetical protein